MLRDKGISVRVVNLPWLNRVDSSWLESVLADCRHVITLDNHYLVGGQGEMLAAAMLGLGLPVTLTRLGLTDIPVCGSNTEVLHALGLDADGIAKVVIGCLDSK